MIAGALVVLPQAFVMSTEYDDVRVSLKIESVGDDPTGAGPFESCQVYVNGPLPETVTSSVLEPPGGTVALRGGTVTSGGTQAGGAAQSP